jgi:hypothetical protein
MCCGDQLGPPPKHPIVQRIRATVIVVSIIDGNSVDDANLFYRVIGLQFVDDHFGDELTKYACIRTYVFSCQMNEVAMGLCCTKILAIGIHGANPAW